MDCSLCAIPTSREEKMRNDTSVRFTSGEKGDIRRFCNFSVEKFNFFDFFYKNAYHIIEKCSSLSNLHIFLMTKRGFC